MFKKSTIYLLIIFGFMLFTFVLFFNGVHYQRQCRDRISTTRTELDIMRKSIEIILDEKGHYPNSLNEVKLFLRGSYYVDFKLKRQNDFQEYRELNDKGGYYYDPNTGKIKLNMTRPVKDYMPSYQGAFKDEIPSEW
jgi:hypothetical protein